MFPCVRILTADSMKPNKSKRNLERVHTVLEKYQSPQKTKGAYLTYLFHGAGYYLKS